MEGYVETQAQYLARGCIHELQAGIRWLGAAGRDPLLMIVPCVQMFLPAELPLH